MGAEFAAVFSDAALSRRRYTPDYKSWILPPFPKKSTGNVEVLDRGFIFGTVCLFVGWDEYWPKIVGIFRKSKKKTAELRCLQHWLWGHRRWRRTPWKWFHFSSGSARRLCPLHM